ncbi:hypothetical protein HPB50_013311 [Hyalomma asiaticum]|uniref:Uncharacterized protein n=1 Tax=Hyalomma asiaticum TaxID=266040 RepID=A0ACB7SNB9_HYAAI|nr:hypothetical protein HPB50_013311 [Hyalomma asiaticum]
MDASSTVESAFGTSGCSSCSEPTSEPASRTIACDRAGARPNRPWPRFAATEAAVPSQQFTLCCTLVSALIVIVLFAITGAVWYRYVVRPGIMLAHPTRAGEAEPRVLVIVVQATDPKRPPAATTNPFLRHGHVHRSSVDAVSLTQQAGTATSTAVHTALEGDRVTEQV